MKKENEMDLGKLVLIEKLKEFGFQYNWWKENDEYGLYTMSISGCDDRFDTVLTIVARRPDKVYISRYKLSGKHNLSYEDVMVNTNDLHTGAKNKLIEFNETFKEFGMTYDGGDQ